MSKLLLPPAVYQQITEVCERFDFQRVATAMEATGFHVLLDDVRQIPTSEDLQVIAKRVLYGAAALSLKRRKMWALNEAGLQARCYWENGGISKVTLGFLLAYYCAKAQPKHLEEKVAAQPVTGRG
jgi:hypothetical protein